MADFTSLKLEVNTNTQGSPTWTQASDAANHEIRFHNTSTAGLGVASASWPYFIRPAAAGGIDYAYVYTADATGQS